MASAIISPDLQAQEFIAYRSDKRPPEEIFRDGFYRRPSSYLDLVDDQMVLVRKPQYRNSTYYSQKGLPVLPVFDINPYSAVCVMLQAAMAPIFPIEQQKLIDDQIIWIYAVVVPEAYATYELQRIDAPMLASCQEVAVNEVPSYDVMGAVKCIRWGGPFGKAIITYIPFLDMQWNPNCRHINQKVTAEQTITPLMGRKIQIDVDQGQIVTRIDTARKIQLVDNPDGTVKQVKLK